MAKSRKTRKEIIIEVARRSFARYGYKRTVIDDIAREAGIAKGTFYLNFRSKEELFLEVIRKIRREIVEEYFERISREATATGKLRETLRFALESLERDPLFAKISGGDEEFRIALSLVEEPETQRMLDGLLGYVRSFFEEGIKNGELRPDIDLDVIPQVFGSLKLLHFSKEAATAGRLTYQQYVDGIVELAMNGIVSKVESAAGERKVSGALDE